MAPFRRPGLEDDEAESRPDTLRPRPSPSFRGPPAYSKTHQHATSHSFAGDEDSVVSGLSAMSDLESLYVESSSNNRPKDARDQYLLAQRLPGQASSDNASEKRSGPTNLLNGFLDENDDEEDNWEDIVYAATLQQSRQPEVAPKQQQTVDPVEQERLDMNRAIAESRLHHEKEQMRLAQIIEDDEESPQKQKKGTKKSSKKSKKKDKPDKKKGGMWSALSGKKNKKR
ncbi:MAG: hypothetical protein SGBAC_008271 [Bacillariaceae sp.]